MKMKIKISIIFLLATVIVSCKVNHHIERHDSIIYKNSIDTVLMYEKEYMNRYVDGDTVFIEKEKIRYRDRVKIKNDTVKINDKVPYPVEVEKVVTPTWCWYLLIGAILCALVRIIILIIKFLQK